MSDSISNRQSPAQRPRIFYGWYIILTFAVTETISWGIVYYAFSVFIVPLEVEFGWSRAQVSGALSVALLISGAMSIPVGFWLDRYGARGLMTAGSIAAVILVYAQASVTTLTGLYLVWAGLGVTMAAILYDPAFVVAAKWFDKRRNAALAVITFAAGFASTIFLPLTNWLLETYGRQQAQIILAVILAIGTIPLHALVIRRDPRDLDLLPDGAVADDAVEGDSAESQSHTSNSVTLSDAIRTPTLWWITTAFAIAGMSAIGIRVHFIPLLLDRGFSPQFAASVAGAIGILQVFGRVLYAPVGSKIPGKVIIFGLMLLQTIALVILRYVPTTAGVWTFVVVFGAGYGALTLARPAIIADLYGPAHFGRINSIMAVVYIFATTSAPFAAGLLYTRANANYDPVLIILALLSVVSALAILPAKPTKLAASGAPT